MAGWPFAGPPRFLMWPDSGRFAPCRVCPSVRQERLSRPQRAAACAYGLLIGIVIGKLLVVGAEVLNRSDLLHPYGPPAVVSGIAAR